MDVREKFEQAQDGFPPPPRDAREVFRRGRRRRSRKIALAGGAGVVAVSVGMVTLPSESPLEAPPIAGQPGANASAELAPDAGAMSHHWPIELVYERASRTERFRGSSWRDWSLERRDRTGEFRLVDREHPSGQLDIEAGALDERDPDMEGWIRAPGPHLIQSWRRTTGLIERAVVPVEQIPGATRLIDDLGLSLDEVEAYVTPNILGCLDSLSDCVPVGEEAARGIAHVPTGFPLYAEEARFGENRNVWIEATSIEWGDPSIEPVPVDPETSDRGGG